MALTVARLNSGVIGSVRFTTATVAFDSSYPTGGEALTAADLFMNDLDVVFAASTGGYVFSYDDANAKLLAYYSDYDAVADGALIQVPDTTNLSAVTGVRVFAIGN